MTSEEQLVQDFVKDLKALVALDYDAVSAYEEAIKRIKGGEYKNKLEEFKKDHQNHIQKLTEFLNGREISSPEGPDWERYVTTGRVIIGDWIGDDLTILKAMRTNEERTYKAYKELTHKYEQIIPIPLKEILEKNLDDEKRHGEWIMENLQEVDAA